MKQNDSVCNLSKKYFDVLADCVKIMEELQSNQAKVPYSDEEFKNWTIRKRREIKNRKIELLKEVK